jgi:hypothetical protein
MRGFLGWLKRLWERYDQLTVEPGDTRPAIAPPPKDSKDTAIVTVTATVPSESDKVMVLTQLEGTTEPAKDPASITAAPANTVIIMPPVEEDARTQGTQYCRHNCEARQVDDPAAASRIA